MRLTHKNSSSAIGRFLKQINIDHFNDGLICMNLLANGWLVNINT